MTSVAKTNQNIKFDPTNFNKQFLENEIIINKQATKQDFMKTSMNNDIILLPHKEPIENIILNIRDLFFQILDLLENKENPIPFIFLSEKRQFSFALFLIIFGTLLLLLSTLMQSPIQFKQ
jgi:hypothetical protein